MSVMFKHLPATVGDSACAAMGPMQIGVVLLGGRKGIQMGSGKQHWMKTGPWHDCLHKCLSPQTLVVRLCACALQRTTMPCTKKATALVPDYDIHTSAWTYSAPSLFTQLIQQPWIIQWKRLYFPTYFFELLQSPVGALLQSPLFEHQMSHLVGLSGVVLAHSQVSFW